MKTRSRLFLISVVAVCLCACSPKRSTAGPQGDSPHKGPCLQSVSISAESEAGQLAGILSASLRLMEGSAPSQVVIVLEDAEPPSLRNAAASLRCTVFRNQLRKSPRYSLPEGYLLLQEVSISGSTAKVQGLLGEVPKATSPDIILLACGTTFVIPLDKSADGSWKVRQSEVQVIVC